MTSAGYSEVHTRIYREVASELHPNENFSYANGADSGSYASRIDQIRHRSASKPRGSIVEPMPNTYRNPYHSAVYEDILAHEKSRDQSEAGQQQEKRYSPFQQQENMYLSRQAEQQASRREGTSREPREHIHVEHFDQSGHFLNKQEPELRLGGSNMGGEFEFTKTVTKVTSDKLVRGV